MSIRNFINIVLEASASNMSRPAAIAVFTRHGVPNAGQLSIPDLIAARKRLLRTYHPDLPGGSNDAMALINSAYDTLKDGEGRQAGRENPWRRPEPEKKPVPKYRMGQWVVILDDQMPGKVININIHNTFGNGYFINYDVKTMDGFTDRYSENQLRAATQEDLDRVAAFPKPKYKVGDYLLSTDDNRVCKVKQGGVAYDRESKCYAYEVEFIDTTGGWDILSEQYLRVATAEEIAAARWKARPKPEPKPDFEVLRFARYVDSNINSNKVYGVVVRNDKIYTFWGGYEKSLTINQQDDLEIANLLFNSKLRKGYKAKIGTPEPWLSNTLKARFAK